MRLSISSPAPAPKRLLLAAAAAALAGACAEPPPAGYPHTLRQVPPAFHGGWDELNDCAGREPRITITADSVHDFEVSWQVREARLLSPTEIDIVIVYLDPERGPTDEQEIWRFRLLDNGRAIAARDGDGTELLRCRDTLGRR